MTPSKKELDALDDVAKETSGIFEDYDFNKKKDKPIKIKTMKHEDVPEVSKQIADINKPILKEKPLQDIIQKTKDMLYKDEQGKVYERQTMTPVSDIRLNNQLLTKLVYLGWAAFIFIVIMTIYIIYNNVVNNIISTIWG